MDISYKELSQYIDYCLFKSVSIDFNLKKRNILITFYLLFNSNGTKYFNGMTIYISSNYYSSLNF